MFEVGNEMLILITFWNLSKCCKETGSRIIIDGISEFLYDNPPPPPPPKKYKKERKNASPLACTVHPNHLQIIFRMGVLVMRNLWL
jgi:hypothetical protein